MLTASTFSEWPPAQPARSTCRSRIAPVESNLQAGLSLCGCGDRPRRGTPFPPLPPGTPPPVSRYSVQRAWITGLGAGSKHCRDVGRNNQRLQQRLTPGPADLVPAPSSTLRTETPRHQQRRLARCSTEPVPRPQALSNARGLRRHYNFLEPLMVLPVPGVTPPRTNWSPSEEGDHYLLVH